MFQATVAQAKVEAKASVDTTTEGDVPTISAEGGGSLLMGGAVAAALRAPPAQMEAQIVSLKEQLAAAQQASTVRTLLSTAQICELRVHGA